MANYATTDDLISRWKPLTADELTQAEVLLTDVSNALKVYAYDRGLDLDQMIEDYPVRGELVTAVVCDVVRREMQSLSDDTPAMSQMSQSAGGYSISGTFLSAGGGLFIKNSELKMIGLMKQRIKMVGNYGTED